MDHYNQVFLQQLAPLVKLFVSDDIGGEISSVLLKYFLNYDISKQNWHNSVIRNRVPSVKYMISQVDSEDISYLDVYLKNSSSEHSQLSPFNVNSDLFPNGILSSKWLQKYVKDLPFAYIAVYKLPQESTADEDDQLANKILQFKQSLLKYGVALSVIVISDCEDQALDDTRVTELRHKTLLPRHNGLLYLNTSPTTFLRDSEILVTSLLSNLKTIANSFYGSKDSRVQERGKKYYSCPSTDSVDTRIEITPKFLETRNLLKQSFLTQFYVPCNLEPSIRLLELAYSNLSELLIECFDGKLIASYKLSKHDTNLHFQFRTLLDVIAYHIVRGYFSLELPLKALKKHGAHVAIITDIASSLYGTIDSTRYWQSIQYEWLGELMELIPHSLFAGANIPKNKSKSIGVGYYGGMKILDSLSYEIFSEPSLNYLHAYYLLTRPLGNSEEREYLAIAMNLTQVKEHRIELLQRAIQTYKLQSKEFDTFVPYLYWLTGEEYFETSKEKAIGFYDKSLKLMTDSNLKKMILQKLLICYEKVQPNKMLPTIVQLAMLNEKPIKSYKQISLDNIEDTTLLLDTFNVDSLVVNESQSNEAFLYETCIFQLLIKPLLSVKLLQDVMPDSTLLLSIDNIKINFASETPNKIAFKNVVLSCDPTSECRVFNKVDLDDNMTGSLNLKFNEDTKIVEFSQIANKVGVFGIDSIELESHLTVAFSDKEVLFKAKQIKNLRQTKNTTDVLFYSIDEGQTKLQTKWVRVNKSSNSIMVKPVKPDITVKFNKELSNIVIGEKVSIPVTIDFHHPKHKKIEYQQLLISPHINVISEIQDKTDLRTQISWDDLKDDESLNLEKLVKLEGGSDTHVLNICVNSPPSSTSLENKYTVAIDIKTIVKEVEQDDMIAVYDLYSVNYPVLGYPFGPKILISPRYDSDDSRYMPSPFIVPEGTTGEDLILPIPVRLWLANVFISNSIPGIDILKVDFNIKPNNRELILDLIGNTQNDATGNYSQLFTTKSKSGYSHRTVTVLTTVDICWKRENSDSEQVFTTEEWEVVLPLSDPRVLLTAEQYDGKKVMLKYILENPTPRIFNFTSQLIVDQTELKTSGWNFQDSRNIFPMKHNLFPVLPFSRHEMIFYGRHQCDEQYLQLPTLKVFDVNYKVGLPTLSVDDSIVIKSGVLYLKLK